jgi:hypothetical protein
MVRSLMGVPPMPQRRRVSRAQLDTALQEEACLSRWPMDLHGDGRAAPQNAQHLSRRMSHQSERKAWREAGNDILAGPITTQRHRAYASVNHPVPSWAFKAKSYGSPSALSCEFHALDTEKSRYPHVERPIRFGASRPDETSGTGFYSS